jgi:sec-independent protein translocase protein TatA
MLFGLSAWELLIILLVILLLFGASRIPRLMRGLGQGVKEFKEAVRPEKAVEEPAGAAPTEKPSDSEK